MPERGWLATANEMNLPDDQVDTVVAKLTPDEILLADPRSSPRAGSCSPGAASSPM